MSVAVLSDAAHANFKYIPNGGPDTTTATTTSPAPVYSTTLPGSTAGGPRYGTVSSTTMTAPMSGGDVINGFGNQVPLVMALREIVPSSYQFAFAEGLNLGTLVSWKGGKPWRDVLQGVVQPLGLTAVERNSVIYVDHAEGMVGER